MHLKHMSALLFLSYLALSTGTVENSGLHSANDVDAGYTNDGQLFGIDRDLLPQRSSVDDSLTELGFSSNSPVYSAIIHLNPDENLLRERRQFYRFGRNHYPFLDESYLKFGLSSPKDVDSYITNSQDESESESDKKPRNRNRRFSNIGSQSKRLLHRNVKSDKSLQLSKALANHMDGMDTRIQDASETAAAIGRGDRSTANQNENNGSDRRFSRFSYRFRRFGHDDNERVNNGPTWLGQLLDSQNDLDKRFMRFGRGYEEDENNNKRFMRFGKSTGYHANDEKRFMRFGKRFMRFGKRFMRFGRKDHDNDYKSMAGDRDLGNVDVAQLGSTIR